MPFPAAIVPVTVTGKIVSGSDGSTAAAGTVTFTMPGPLYDTADNVLLSAVTYTATLDGAGSFSISLPPTNSPNVNPSNWEYSVRILTAPHSEYGAIQVPYNGGTVNFNSAYTPGLAADSGNTFVPASGGTMTGDLILSGSDTDLTVGGNLTVSGSSTMTYQGITENVMRLVSTAISTGVISGGELTPNVDPTKLDIAAMSGWIVEYNSAAAPSATNPQLISVSISAQVGLALTGPLSQIVTWWLVNSSGTIVQQAAEPTPTQRRTHIVLGATAQFGGSIFASQALPVVQSQPANQLADLMDALGTFSKSGNVLSANGVNLTINKSVGTMFARAFSYIPSYLDPHNSDLPAQTPVSGRRATATTTLSPLETLLDVGNYDPSGSGVVTVVPGGANASTNFRVWAFATNATSDQLIIQYGQNSHASLANAVAAIGAGSYIRNPAFTGGALLGWISVIRTATDLSDSAQAVFTAAPKFATP